ncbi:MAG: fumarate hydratase [Clostridia bacterium]|nr:fumarate hydratase [Clostridia bacterium]
MRIIKETEIVEAIEKLFADANVYIPCDVQKCLKQALDNETSDMSRDALRIICENNEIAKERHMPICQDTGMAIVFAKVGMQIHIDSDRDLIEIINEGVRRAYANNYLRMSVVGDPLRRKNTNDNTPAIVYVELVKGDKLELTALPKGFGSENMSRIKMFNPTVSVDDIIDFIVDTVKTADAKPCPPVVVGVGIGGTFDYSAVLSKLALARSVSSSNSDPFYAEMEQTALKRINELGIGVQGFSGNNTAIAVNIEKYPTHIAGLPVAVNICCHVARHKTCII